MSRYQLTVVIDTALDLTPLEREEVLQYLQRCSLSIIQDIRERKNPDDFSSELQEFEEIDRLAALEKKDQIH